MKATLLKFCLGMFLCMSSYAQTTFAPIENIDPNTGEQPYEIETGDLDGDGDLDLVMATNTNPSNENNTIRWYSNGGSGNFSIEGDISTTIRWVDGLEIADIDGQFGLDIIASSTNQNKVVYFLSDGSGGFGAETPIDSALAAPGEVKAGDINLDGDMDIIVPSFSEFRTVWYAGDGTGGFSAAQNVQIDGGGVDTPYFIDVADYDGDTDIDVLVGIFKFPGPQRIEIYYNQYIESGSTAVSWIKDTQSVDAGVTRMFDISFADVNNDSQLDVISSDVTTGDVIWYNKIKNGTSTPTIISNSTIISNPAAARVIDIDGDALNDVIVTDFGSADDAIIWFKGNSNASPDATPTTIVDNNFQIVDIAIGDFDGNIDNDIATVGYFSDSVDWLDNELNTLSLSGNDPLEGLQIYPNPAKDVINIKTNSPDNLRFSVVDVVGKEIINDEVYSEKSLDISALESGMYIIKFEASETTFKFIKE
ncbi:MAG: T9SS type A sorting domain-containing protein [Psychroserpens sp.]|nr:T9SS type A sorting domain-containing protein [Psychroserpens sp.]